MKAKLILFSSLLAWSLVGKTVVNDVTQLNPIEVDQVVTPTSIEEVQKYVHDSQIPVSIGGGHFSMGGQTASENTLHLDMRQFDKVVEFHPEAKTITVQSGITWRKVQEAIDGSGLSVKIMQSYANFTVGGSLSVNVHGRYVGEGPLVLSVRSFKIVLADGHLVEASPTKHSDIFYGAIGGYGGLGVIVEATLDLAVNDRIEHQAREMKIGEYRKFFENEVRHNAKAVFHNGDIYPPAYQKVIAITWEKTDKPVTVPDHLMPAHRATWMERAEIYAMAQSRLAKHLRAKVLDPRKVKDHPVVYRNYEASYDVYSLEPASRAKSTYVLQEYFVPVDKFDEFTPRMAKIFQESKANILNVSIRHAKKDPGTLLAWAKEESFAFVVYYEQGTSPTARAKVGEWTRQLIDAAVAVGGSYYLPYQIVGTDEQFHQAYPHADEYFALKKKLDPDYKFRNKLWDRYYHKRTAANGRPEEDSFLTLPEWFVVYSADDYADFLKRGGRPSHFAYFRSVGDFWHLYRSVTARTWHDYPLNFGTHLMISVVGLSYSAEYLGRGIYEGTIGRLSETIGGYGKGTPTSEDVFLSGVADEYARFIHDTPWYAFPFGARLKAFHQVKSDPKASWFRARERSFEGVAELGAKSAWAWLIGLGTRATWAPAELTTTVRIQKHPGLLDPQLKKLDDSDPFFTDLQAPRYQKFTDLFRTALGDVQLEAVETHHKMVVSLIAPREWKGAASGEEVLDQNALVSADSKKRVYLVADVRHLHSLVPGLLAQGVQLEHLYDY